MSSTWDQPGAGQRRPGRVEPTLRRPGPNSGAPSSAAPSSAALSSAAGGGAAPAVTGGPHEPGLEALLAALEALPAQRPVTLQVVTLADDPRASARDLAAVAAGDPVLAARLLRMANSAYFGLSGRISDLPFAVTVIGFATVRALAAAAAAGATGPSLPEGFWLRAATYGLAAGVVAAPLGARSAQAVCGALLLDLGQAVLSRHDPAGYPAIYAEHQQVSARLCAAEADRYGVDHAGVTARVLGAWRFPQPLVAAIATHHAPAAALSSPLHRTLWVARQVAHEVLTGDADPDALPYSYLSGGALDPELLVHLRTRVEDEAEGLAAALGT